MKRTVFLLLFLFCCTLTKIYALSADSTQISLLTVMPRSNAVYTMFGHTAIRIFNPSRKVDFVFNYGVFSFDRPGFLYYFLKGETDYAMGEDNYRQFYAHYAFANSTVVEQVLDIPVEDKNAMIYMLAENLQPQNRIYRYNFFFDNCSTRPRNIIERFCGSKILNYSNSNETSTFRALVYECTSSYPWVTFGIDLLIGSGADSTIGIRNEMFLPVKLMGALDKAYVINDSSLEQHFIVSSTKEIMHAEPDTDAATAKFWNSPMNVGFVLCALYVVICIAGFMLKRPFRFFFSILFFAAGLGGIIVAFVAFISTHPCTWPNWNLLWIHPLHLIPTIGYLFKKTYKLIRWYHWGNFVLLSSLLLGWSLIPQELNIACIPFILCLWVSSGYKLLIDKKLSK